MIDIQLKNISKSFNNEKVLYDINLNIQKGEMISLLGPSGCGKSTTLKIISGLIAPEQGDILFNGLSVKNIPVEKRGAVIVFQDHLLFPHMTVEENIGFGLKMIKIRKEKIKEQVKAMLTLVQLNGYESKYPHELSGGERQRIAIARALAIQPKVLLLDEPFSNLDGELRKTMRDFLCNLQKRLKITTILVTHDTEEALIVSDRIAVMLDGEIMQFDKPKVIYEKPSNIKLANFLGDKNYISGKFEKGVFYSLFGDFPVGLTYNGEVRAMIRPEEVIVGSENEIEGITGVITRKQYAGNKIYYKIQIEGIEINSLSDSNYVFEVGEKIKINTDFSKVIFYDMEDRLIIY